MLNRQLYVFVSCVESGSFAKAAEKLYLSPPAVMKHVNELEKKLGITLFERTSRGVMPTAAGRAFYEDAERMIALASEARTHAVQAAEREHGEKIRIGTIPLYNTDELFALIQKHGQIFSRFSVQALCFDADSGSVRSHFDKLGKEIDFFFASGDSRVWLRQSKACFLGKYPLRVAVPARHPLSHRKSLSISDLAGEQIMVFQSGESPLIDHFRDELQKSVPSVQMRSTSYYDINTFNYCDENNCLLVSFDIWQNIHPSLVTKPVDWNFTLPYGLFYSPDISGTAAEFLHAVEKLADM